MRVVVNGTAREVPRDATVAQLLRRLEIGEASAGVAVARNGEVVLRSRWQVTPLGEGDTLEVLQAVQGG